MKSTWPTRKCCVGAPTPPIFHWKWGSRWLPDANEIYKKKRNVHGQRKKLASPDGKYTNMLVFLALGNAKVPSFALANAKVPNASSFASQWNIGLRLCFIDLNRNLSVKIKINHFNFQIIIKKKITINKTKTIRNLPILL